MNKDTRKKPAVKVSLEQAEKKLAEAEEEIGQLSVDVYESPSELTIIAPIAGVKLQDINIGLTDDILVISGKRSLDFKMPVDDYIIQECFWGEFSRSIVLPDNADQSQISASFKEGILKITIPKTPGHNKTKLIRIKND
jgi:HSP20 family protein